MGVTMSATTQRRTSLSPVFEDRCKMWNRSAESNQGERGEARMNTPPSSAAFDAAARFACVSGYDFVPFVLGWPCYMFIIFLLPPSVPQDCALAAAMHRSLRCVLLDRLAHLQSIAPAHSKSQIACDTVNGVVCIPS